jgi:hypothetical protein
MARTKSIGNCVLTRGQSGSYGKPSVSDDQATREIDVESRLSQCPADPADPDFPEQCRPGGTFE